MTGRGGGLTTQGERAARQRVEAIYAAVDRLPPEALSWTTLPPRDLEERTILLATLEREVDRRGRGALLDEARDWLREALDQRVSSRGYRPEAGVWGVSDIGRAEDLARMRLALEDAVSVAVAEDLVDPADAAALAAPGRSALGLDPLPGSPADLEPGTAWEPTPADWANADDVAEDELEAHGGDPAAPGRVTRSRGATVAVAVIVAIVGLMLLATGSVGLAMLAGAGVGALGWSAYAGPRRP